MFDVHYSLIFSRPFHSVFKIPIDMCLLILIFYRNAPKFQFYESEEIKQLVSGKWSTLTLVQKEQFQI